MNDNRMFKFNPKKAIETILYITEYYNNVYKVLKTIYFADRYHLSEWGRTIYGEFYAALNYGPVPSTAYDFIKFVRGDGQMNPPIEIAQDFAMVDFKTIRPLRKADRQYLSDSEIGCLNKSINFCKNKSFDELCKLSHDDAFKSADENGIISMINLIDSLPNAKNLKEHLFKE
ncbi:MAG: hypothetical protein A2161_05205 [Candidatus Schekmanbacteria bacterium RBG_13_48_7]|uniref:Antitoxin SocA-like Panacea domain-containing protein n=1 Tax=Candidatus Schekmanbacteria bacterium RBG_13_48_7 TaxID=1817878 RepID=A0A1F7RNK1_9BACT|nr:MAG: hypothetical protein A2161_05205 [Candidatus Schekmanbacteria bacterium RBG_13_48_7]